VVIRIDPGNSDSALFSQFLSSSSSVPSFDSQEGVQMQIDLSQALKEINIFNEFWTYEGSLTSPPRT
jgi:carbonic anhydrase